MLSLYITRVVLFIIPDALPALAGIYKILCFQYCQITPTSFVFIQTLEEGNIA